MTAFTPTTSTPIPQNRVHLALRQTAALLTDAFRRLRAAKLFWVALGLSFLVAAACGYVGINERGLSFPGFGEWKNDLFNSKILPPGEFYKTIFLGFGVSIWLAYAANMLALVSTAGLIPELISDGSVDLYLSRPVGRVRLFLTRYVTGLLFVAMQALCFSIAAIGVFWIRAGVFLPGLLWAVVYVTMFFSFLYCISALVGLLTGSGITAILLTALVWMFIWAADWAETITLVFREQAAVEVEMAEHQLQRSRNSALQMSNASEISQSMTADAVGLAEADLAQKRGSHDTVSTVHRVMMAVKAPLPKTGETMARLQRRLTNESDVRAFEEKQAADAEERRQRIAADQKDWSDERREEFLRDQQAETEGAERTQDAYVNRSVWWTFGTSFAFEGVLLAICCWIFARRDM